MKVGEEPSGRRWWSLRFGLRRLCLQGEPRTLSDLSDVGEEQSETRQASAATLPELSAAPAVERRDDLRRLPSQQQRALGDSPSAKRAAFAASRTLGSLTAWQLLAADIASEMDAAAAGGAGGGSSARCSQMSEGRHSERSSQVGAWMADDPPAPPTDPSGQSSGSSSSSSESRSGGGGDTAAAGGAPSRLSSRYEVLGELGRGAFGCALKARRRADGALVCIKALDASSMDETERRMVRLGLRGGGPPAGRGGAVPPPCWPLPDRARPRSCCRCRRRRAARCESCARCRIPTSWPITSAGWRVEVATTLRWSTARWEGGGAGGGGGRWSGPHLRLGGGRAHHLPAARAAAAPPSCRS